MPLALGALLGAIIGGVAALLIVSIASIILFQQYKHRRLLAHTNAAGERRLSRYPGGHLSITDEDVARMPGTRAVFRRSMHTHYGRTPPFAQMTSMEELHPQTILKSLSKARVNDVDHGADNPESAIPHQSWPLPRRLTRSSARPTTKAQSLSVPPISEKAREAVRFVPAKRVSESLDQEPKKEEMVKAAPMEGKRQENGSPPATTSPGVILKPKPLFHDQGRRSVSHGTLSRLPGSRSTPAGLYVFDSVESKPKAMDKPRLPRSVSLSSQEPGLAPTQPVPPLPLEVQKIKSMRDLNARRGSGMSLPFSDRTSVVDDDASKVFSHIEADFASVSLVSRPTEESTIKDIGVDESNAKLWDPSDQENTNPVGAARPLNFRPQLNSQKSFRVSIQSSLPRSTSSGVSMSMLDHPWSRNASSASLSRDAQSAQAKSMLAVPGSAERKKSRRGVSPSSLLSHGSDFDIHEDVKRKRASDSVLNMISGNQGSPVSNVFNNRPSSIVTEKSFQWDALTSMLQVNSSTTAGGAKGHKRKTVRISQIHPALPSENPLAIVEQGEKLREPSVSIDAAKEAESHRTSFRPPSRSTFDPQLTPTPRSRNSHRNSNQNPYSPTLSMINLFQDEDDSSPESTISTPTRKPSVRRPSGAHPNRQRRIFDSPTTPIWPLPTTANDIATTTAQVTSDPEKPNIFRLSAQLNSQATNSEPRPISFLLPFPSPPRRLNVPNWRGPKSAIRGPRAPPSGFSAPPPRRSPAAFRGVGKVNGVSPGRDLRKSILALRRMNSEVNEVTARPGREQKRYLSMGGSESSALVEERDGKGGLQDEAVVEEGSEGKENRDVFRFGAARAKSVRGPRGMPEEGSARESPGTSKGIGVGVGLGLVQDSPGSLYGADGFLKE